MEALKKLSYEKLMANDPTEYDRTTNQLGQTVVFVEHPFKGDEYPVIAVFPEEKIAVATDFYDTGDFYEGSEYMPVVVDGQGYSYFEIEDKKENKTENKIMNNKKIQQITESVVAEVKTLAKEGKTINKVILDGMIKKHLSESKLIKEGAISDTWERFENLKEILGESTLLDAIYEYFGGWKMKEAIDSIETDYDINQEEDDDDDFEDEEIEEGKTYTGADKKNKIKQYQSTKPKKDKMYVGESKKRSIKESIDDFKNNGGTEEEYLDSPEYFEETFINGQFSQLRNMLAKSVKTGKIKDILVYLDGNNQGEIIRWIAENR